MYAQDFVLVEDEIALYILRIWNTPPPRYEGG